MLKICSLIIGLLLLYWHVSAQDLDPKKIVGDALSNGNVTYSRMKAYAFDLKISLRMFDGKGQVKETMVYRSPAPLTRKENESGYRELILIEKNGKPLSDDKVKKQTERADQRIDKLEEKQASSPKRTVDGQPGYLKLGNIPFGKSLLSPTTILGKCAFTDPTITSISGRSAIELQFTSCSTDGLSKDEMDISKLKGRVWIDEADKVLSRLEAWIPNPKLANPSNDPQFTYEQTKVDSNWFPKKARIDGSSKFLASLLFSVENVESTFEFGDYKLYEH
jgi:hypothetical protein